MKKDEESKKKQGERKCLLILKDQREFEIESCCALGAEDSL
jgi:hypothetical protein